MTIDRAEVLRYLGYGGERPDAEMEQLIVACEREIEEISQPKYRWRVFEREGERVLGTKLTLEGNAIQEHLLGCTRVGILAATLGAEADRRIHRAQVSDLTRALVLDAVANAAIEEICNLAEGEICASLPGWSATWRFSPGYGDFPLALQNELLAVLDAPRRIGLCANESSLLTPRKSVTAVVGLSTELIEKGRRGCAVCMMNERCPYRKRGEHCDI